jgi:glycerol-3-phosphate dehydrogenase (NAD(P)+)
VHTAKATLELARKHAVEMPITEAVYNCLHNDMSINEAIKDLLSRPFKT